MKNKVDVCLLEGWDQTNKTLRNRKPDLNFVENLYSETSGQRTSVKQNIFESHQQNYN